MRLSFAMCKSGFPRKSRATGRYDITRLVAARFGPGKKLASLQVP
jgi:hypothetical protein